MNRTIINGADAARAFMAELGVVGSYDVRADGSRATGWVGKPGEADEVAVTITIEPLPPLGER